MRISAERILGADGWITSAQIEISDGKVVAVGPAAQGAEPVDGWIVPGYFDSHSHGGGGGDYGSLDADEVRQALAFQRKHGSTSVIASLVTGSIDHMCKQLDVLAELQTAGEIVGVHLEGPFLAPEFKGAHELELLIKPNRENVSALIDRHPGLVKMVTLAPELGEMQIIKQFTDAGVRVAFGHSNADYDLACRAIEAGADIATHLFNAMHGIHHRNPGPIPALLEAEGVMVELIADNTHVHPSVLRMAIDAAGLDRVALITDAMSATGMPDGDYMLGKLPVSVVDSVARLRQPDGTLGAIAGSTLTLDMAIKNIVSLGISLEDAVAMATRVPARWHRVEGIGVLAPGAWADLCVLSKDADVLAVMRRGKWL